MALRYLWDNTKKIGHQKVKTSSGSRKLTNDAGVVSLYCAFGSRGRKFWIRGPQKKQVVMLIANFPLGLRIQAIPKSSARSKTLNRDESNRLCTLFFSNSTFRPRLKRPYLRRTWFVCLLLEIRSHPCLKFALKYCQWPPSSYSRCLSWW